MKIKDLLQKHPQGLSITGIVKEVNISRSTAGRYLETLLASGHVDMRLFGMAKIYTLSHRVPSSSVLSISSELILQLDSHLRIIYVNEPFVEFLNTSREELIGKNIQYSVLVPVLDDIFGSFLDRVRNGIKGVEWKGELFIESRGTIFTCRIAPTVLDNGKKGASVVFE
ncbi:MAG: PAS domain-containing protein, partial [Methanoregula sp.]